MSVPLTGSPSARFNTATRDKLRMVAKYQRWVLLAQNCRPAPNFAVFIRAQIR
jgi:hypothetical protein